MNQYDVQNEQLSTNELVNNQGTITKQAPAYAGFAYCNQLFQIEDQLKELPPEERHAQRLELERPVLDAFWKWIDSINPLGGSKLSRAIKYALNQKKYMENYLLVSINQDAGLQNRNLWRERL